MAGFVLAGLAYAAAKSAIRVARAGKIRAQKLAAAANYYRVGVLPPEPQG